jgi:hypothetical protein
LAVFFVNGVAPEPSEFMIQIFDASFARSRPSIERRKSYA